jgi:hypothetical protein
MLLMYRQHHRRPGRHGYAPSVVDIEYGVKRDQLQEGWEVYGATPMLM